MYQLILIIKSYVYHYFYNKYNLFYMHNYCNFSNKHKTQIFLKNIKNILLTSRFCNLHDICNDLENI